MNVRVAGDAKAVNNVLGQRTFSVRDQDGSFHNDAEGWKRISTFSVFR
jgi:hypothetical protein